MGQGEFYAIDNGEIRQIGPTHTNWRTTWDLIVPESFGGGGGTGLLFYDRSGSVGQGEFYAIDNGEIRQIGPTHTNWRTTWDLIVPGSFGGGGGTGLLFYDRSGSVGQGEFYAIDNGEIRQIGPTHTNWRTTWDLIVPESFGGGGGTGLLFYDRSSGVGEFYAIDNGEIRQIGPTHTDWRTTWDLIVPGSFGGGGATDLLFYDRSARVHEFWAINHGTIRRIPFISSDLPLTWDEIVPGLFGGSGDTTDLLHYAKSSALAPLVTAPREILEIDYVNPRPGFDLNDPNWPTTIIGGTGTYPNHSGKEWVQVLDPREEYDAHLIGATGWLIGPEFSGSDVPFSHPFGFDWEFYVALDSDYSFLLAPANTLPADQVKRAKDLQIQPQPAPARLLGVEIDGGLVPPDFVSEVKEGHRVAVFGRWIVDAAHYDQYDDGGQKGFRTEIHPPLLMACASPRESDGATRVVFTTRPYLVGQTYSTDENKIYDDLAEDDGGLHDHFVHEIVKLNTFRSLGVEAHPKIKSQPLSGGPHQLHFKIRPAAPRAPGQRLSISFSFTVRARPPSAS